MAADTRRDNLSRSSSSSIRAPVTKGLVLLPAVVLSCHAKTFCLSQKRQIPARATCSHQCLLHACMPSVIAYRPTLVFQPAHYIVLFVVCIFVLLLLLAGYDLFAFYFFGALGTIRLVVGCQEPRENNILKGAIHTERRNMMQTEFVMVCRNSKKTFVVYCTGVSVLLLLLL